MRQGLERLSLSSSAVRRAEAATETQNSVATCFAALRAKAMRLKGQAAGVQPAAVPMPVAPVVAATAGVKNVPQYFDITEEEVSIGAVLAVLDAKNSQDTAVSMICAATGNVLLLGFSFDRDDVLKALLGARRRGCHVRVVLDRAMTLTGKTRNQLSAAKELVSGGVLVRCSEGLPVASEYAAVGRKVPGYLKGIQHSKSLLCDSKLLVGSTNWTTSSRSNWELGVQVRLDRVEPVFELMMGSWHAGVDLSIAQISEAQRSRSESPSGRGRRG